MYELVTMCLESASSSKLALAVAHTKERSLIE